MINPLELLTSLGNRGLNPRELQKFLANNNTRNQWLDVGPYKTYLRKGERILPRGDHTRIRDMGRFKTLELANVEREGRGAKTLPEGERPTKGQFGELVKLLETEATKNGYDAVYVEQILNEFLPEVLRRKGYVQDPTAYDKTIPNMYQYINRRI